MIMHEKEMRLFLGMVTIFLLLGVGSFIFFWVAGDSGLQHFFKHPLETTQNQTQAIAQTVERNLADEPLVLKTAATPTLTPKPATPSATTTNGDFEVSKLYALINGYRRDNKLPPLKIHTLLEQTAHLKLQDMQAQSYWTHKDPKGRESWYMFEQVGYHFEHAGENLSTGYNSPWQVFDHWKQSPEHNAQMLQADYEHMGLAADCTSYSLSKRTSCVVVLHLGKQLL